MCSFPRVLWGPSWAGKICWVSSVTFIGRELSYPSFPAVVPVSSPSSCLEDLNPVVTLRASVHTTSVPSRSASPRFSANKFLCLEGQTFLWRYTLSLSFCLSLLPNSHHFVSIALCTTPAFLQHLCRFTHTCIGTWRFFLNLCKWNQGLRRN